MDREPFAHLPHKIVRALERHPDGSLPVESLRELLSIPERRVLEAALRFLADEGRVELRGDEVGSEEVRLVGGNACDEPEECPAELLAELRRGRW